MVSNRIVVGFRSISPTVPWAVHSQLKVYLAFILARVNVASSSSASEIAHSLDGDCPPSSSSSSPSPLSRGVVVPLFTSLL